MQDRMAIPGPVDETDDWSDDEFEGYMNSDNEASDHGEDRCVEESEEGEDEDECGAQQCEGAIPQYTCRPCCTQPAGDGSPLHYLDTFPTRKHTFPTPEHLTNLSIWWRFSTLP